jgi:NhaP-type Na+/H+ or K+/H+ antiporter
MNPLLIFFAVLGVPLGSLIFLFIIFLEKFFGRIRFSEGLGEMVVYLWVFAFSGFITFCGIVTLCIYGLSHLI